MNVLADNKARAARLVLTTLWRFDCATIAELERYARANLHHFVQHSHLTLDDVQLIADHSSTVEHMSVHLVGRKHVTTTIAVCDQCGEHVYLATTSNVKKACGFTPHCSGTVTKVMPDRTGPKAIIQDTIF